MLCRWVFVITVATAIFSIGSPASCPAIQNLQLTSEGVARIGAPVFVQGQVFICHLWYGYVTEGEIKVVNVVVTDTKGNLVENGSPTHVAACKEFSKLAAVAHLATKDGKPPVIKKPEAESSEDILLGAKAPEGTLMETIAPHPLAPETFPKGQAILDVNGETLVAGHWVKNSTRASNVRIVVFRVPTKHWKDKNLKPAIQKMMNSTALNPVEYIGGEKNFAAGRIKQVASKEIKLKDEGLTEIRASYAYEYAFDGPQPPR